MTITVPPPPTRLRRLGRSALRITRLMAILYLVLMALAPLLQRVLMFPASLLPTASLQSDPDHGMEPITLNTPAGELRGLFCHASGPRADLPGRRPTILYFYGNGSTVNFSHWELNLLRQSGANVLVADYPGYGASPGRPSEAALYQTADALYDFALQQPDVDPHQILAVGWSLGGAVAIDLASRKPLAGLMTLSTFTDMDTMARLRMPILPTDLLITNHFYSIRKLAPLHIPIAILHGTDDGNVPFFMADQLRQAAIGAPFVLYCPIPGAGHNDIFPLGQRQITEHLQVLLRCAADRDSVFSHATTQLLAH